MLCFAELFDPPAQRAAYLSQSSNAEDDEDDEQYNNEFSWTHLKWHGSTSNPICLITLIVPPTRDKVTVNALRLPTFSVCTAMLH